MTAWATMKRSSQRPAGLMTPARRGLTIGPVLTITLVAFEARCQESREREVD